jgi:hypothetical protein
VCEDVCASVENCFVKGETYTAMECCGICKTEGKLNALYCPRRIGRCEFESDARDGKRVAYVSCKIIDHSNFDEASVKAFDD